MSTVMKEYLCIERNGAKRPEEVYAQFEQQSDFLAPDCCGGGVSVEDIADMLANGYITLDGDKIRLWVNG